jgi:benzodiazapine receptor
VALFGTSTAYAVTASKVDRAAAWMIAPYVGWIGFAGSINAGVVALNPGE